MKRRNFCLSVGSALAIAAVPPTRLWAREPSMPADLDPIGGFTTTPARRLLFTDLRHIETGDLSWKGPEGQTIPVAGPPDPVVDAIADLGILPRGLRLEAEPGTKEGPLEAPFKWTDPKTDRGVYRPSEVVYDDGVYKSWFLTTIYPEGQDLGSYSTAKPLGAELTAVESEDGFAWHETGKSTIDVKGMTGVETVSVFIDPAAEPEERYKGVFHAMMTDGVAEMWKEYQKIHPRHRDVRLGPDKISCMFGVVSPDGRTWKQLREPLMIHMGDTDNGVYYDEWLGKYVMYTRLYWLRRRLIARAESEDFRHWTPVTPMIWSNLNDPMYFDVYCNARTTYPGMPDYHLMFPEFYDRYTQTSLIRLFSSYDGICWNEVPGGPVLEPGAPGQWDGAYIVARRNLVPLKDRIGMPFESYDHPHKYPRWPGVIRRSMGWATWPEGRLSGLVADEEGEFHTFPVAVTGRELRVNARVHRAGYVKIGIVGNDGRSTEDCDPIVGDVTARTVTWKGTSNVGAPEGKDVRLHVKLRSAKLFGIEWV